jgi:hypothetical protein
LSNERIDLSQAQRRLCVALQIAAHETVVVDFHFQGDGAGLVDPGHAILFVKRQQALDAAHGGLSLRGVQGAAEGADVMAGALGAAQQLQRAQWCLPGPVLVVDVAATATLPHVFPE